jgi:squalene-hopene/tetraprenyl-beta-curcumene cyclase
MRLVLATVTLIAACVGAMVVSLHSDTAAKPAASWSPKAAASYLDYREAWWMQWSVAARDQKTFCVSCHTVLPYALARPELARKLGEDAPPVGEVKVLEDVRKRVRLWKEIAPYYTENDGPHKAAQSRGTEAVLNALILASADATGARLSNDTLAAFAEMWQTQEMEAPGRGAWSWLQFDNEPFEGHDSEYYGAALAGVAIGVAPQNYRNFPEIQKNIKLLSEYLNRKCTSQSLINQVTALWASEELPGLFTKQRQQAIIGQVLSRQRADGGWSLAPLSWSWRDWTGKSLIKLWMRSNATPLDPKSDGYATGLIAYALERAGMPRDNPHLKNALTWLEHNQNAKDGFWPGYSLNNRVDPSSDMGRFMTDAATGFAVLALTERSAGL